MKGKIIILSAPSGTGKSTIIHQLIKETSLKLGFSISATSRAPRGQEQNGVDYYFYSAEEFKQKVEEHQFVEWEEVYPGCYYGTLRSEIQRITENGNNLIMDVDVKGALSIKEIYGDEALSICLLPPDIGTLYKRLKDRGTDDDDVIARRIAKAEYEMTFAPRFDKIVVNDNLDKAVEAVRNHITEFINK
jgi:guanylate kinase